MQYFVRHITEYIYQQPTTLSYNEAWLQPRELPYQKIVSSQIKVYPEPIEISYREDFFGNKVAYFSLHEPHKEFKVVAESLLDRKAPLSLKNENISYIAWREVLKDFEHFSSDLIDVKSFILPSPVVPLLDTLKHYARPSFDKFTSLYEAVSDLNSRIYTDFEYNTEITNVATPLVEVAKIHKGVCQDFAHIAIGCLRALGFPARYVSGYIETISPDGEPNLIGTAASHAWFAVYIPKMGWIDFDPTNNQLAQEQHITVAWGRDYQDVPPLKGVIFNNAQHELTVGVEVRRLNENKVMN